VNCFEIKKAREVFGKGGNVTEFLRDEAQSEVNTSDIIEIAYDLQAGSYIESVRSNMAFALRYVDEIATLLSPHLTSNASLLDVGTGELTTFSLLISNNMINPRRAYAFDLSWSRLSHGVEFWRDTVNSGSPPLVPFVADMGDIPLISKSIDVVISSHALEPNGGSLDCLLSELFRICRYKLVLFEPSYELNSIEGKARMDRLGYIKDIEGAVTRLDGKLESITPMRNISNPLNPTTCYVITPPGGLGHNILNNKIFSVPGTDFRLKERNGFYVSEDTGLVFPILDGIPVLKSSAGILATSLST